MKKIAILIIIIGSALIEANAQSKSGYRIEGGKPGKSSRSKSSSGWTDNLFFQPSFGFSFGQGSLYLTAAPAVGYKILDGWDAGVGMFYSYSKFDEQPGYFGYSSNTIGGNFFSRFVIKEPFFIMAQYEVMGTVLEIDAPNNGGYSEERDPYDAFLAGGGIMQPVGRNGAFVASILYNFSYNSNDPFDNGPYTSPYAISFGFVVGF
ncbi:MAG: hypothetical protein JXR07_00645 [Reichenbachiella sp.]